jgi:sulfur-carrier protein
MIRVIIPYHLKTLSGTTGEIQLDVPPPVTLRTVLDALESRYPMLRGTVRDHATDKRRDFIRFYACEQDFSNESVDTPLPEKIAAGAEPFLIIGAIAGG